MAKEAEPGRWRAIGRTLLAVFFLYHAAAITLCHVPATSALRPQIAKASSRYLLWTGTWQSWTMFDAPPEYHSYDVDLVAIGEAGDERRFGPLLPTFSDLGNGVRDRTLFLRIARGSYTRYLPEYFDTACRLLRANDPSVKSVKLRERIVVLPNHAELRTGNLGSPRVHETKPHRCPP